MPSDVIQLVPNKICLDEDLAELDFCLEAAAPASFEKYHLLSLLHPILESDKVHQHCKNKAIKMIVKHSDNSKIIARYGSGEIAKILHEVDAKVRNIG